MDEPDNGPPSPPTLPIRLTKGKEKDDPQSHKCAADADPNTIEESEEEYDQLDDLIDNESGNSTTPHKTLAHPSKSKASHPGCHQLTTEEEHCSIPLYLLSSY